MTQYTLSNKTTTQTMEIPRVRNFKRWIYPAVVVAIYFVWMSYMFMADAWGLFLEHWAISLIMTFGSFVAGATAEGGGAVAFPVFTKALHIPPGDARTFGLMIQAVGMMTAALVIYLRDIRILNRVVIWVSIGGILGQVLGTYWLIMPQPYPRILFTLIAGTFGVTLLIGRFWLRWEPLSTIQNWGQKHSVMFIGLGILGGIFAAQIGTGIDMLTFIVLTLAFGIHEKVSTPTTVVIMGINSVVGFYLHGVVSQDIGIVWEYWLVAVPIVIIGAPLGAIIASKVNRDAIIALLTVLIAVEVISTVLLIPFTHQMWVFTAMTITACVVIFLGLLRLRQEG